MRFENNEASGRKGLGARRERPKTGRGKFERKNKAFRGGKEGGGKSQMHDRITTSKGGSGLGGGVKIH